MPAVCVFAPAVVAGWPAISAAVSGAAAVLGLSVASKARESVKARVEGVVAVEVAVRDSEVIGEQLQAEEESVFVSENIRYRVFRDARGSVRIYVEGVGRTKKELEALGEELAQKIARQFVYNKLVSELKARKFVIIDEQVEEDEAVRLRVRTFVE